MLSSKRGEEEDTDFLPLIHGDPLEARKNLIFFHADVSRARLRSLLGKARAFAVYEQSAGAETTLVRDDGLKKHYEPRKESS